MIVAASPWRCDRADQVNSCAPCGALRPAREIEIPGGVGYHPDENGHPEMEPITVWQDASVTVSAALVDHPPVAPAFGYRFDTWFGSVVVSGDTAPSRNLIRLARDADPLLHEVLDFAWVEQFHGAPGERSRRAQSVVDHHYRAHTSPRGAVEVAEAAGVRAVAFHHFVSTRDAGYWRAQAGPTDMAVIIPADGTGIRVPRARCRGPYRGCDGRGGGRCGCRRCLPVAVLASNRLVERLMSDPLLRSLTPDAQRV
ncbi:hypothetical protein [Microbacterium sp.]|uniref:hypothetical protein n=1 Tax=Microbacterium sp. TaxID=51671 RepID=UPI003A84F373